MAVKKYILTHKNDDTGEADIVHFQTGSESVVRPNGTTAEDYFSTDHSTTSEKITVGGEGSSQQTLEQFVSEVKNYMNTPIRLPVLANDPANSEPGEIWMIRP